MVGAKQQVPIMRCGNLIERAAGFGMESEKIDGLSVSDVYGASYRAIEKKKKMVGRLSPCYH